MNLLLALIFGVWAMNEHPADISNIPFSQLTINMILATLFYGALWVGALFFVCQSIAKDRIWPWRWTSLYVMALLLRTAIVLVVGVATLWLMDHSTVKNTAFEVVIPAAGAVLILFFMFTPDINFEKKVAPLEQPPPSP